MTFFDRSASIDDYDVNLRKLTGVVLVTAIAGFPRAGVFAWETRLDKDGILVQSRLNAGSKYEEFRAEAEIDATVAQAMALLIDTSACTQWLFRCKEGRVIRENSSTERTFYQVTSLLSPQNRVIPFFMLR